jgi:prepilin-type processing-associated H-X9-DG protein
MAKTPVAKHTTSFGAFTCIELLACLAACALLVAIIAPALATARSRSDRVACMSNLRQIGNALRQFALEHDGNPAWTAVTGPDGNFNEPGKHELWFQYWWLRDSLGTPKILMDPGDTRSSVATEWGLEPGVGLQSLKNRAVSYPLGMGLFRGSDYEYTDVPRTIIALDRHFIHSAYSGGCSGGLVTCAEVSPETTGWYNDVHGVVFGNVAFADGSVESLAAEQLREAVRKLSSTYIRIHVADWSQ